MGAAILDGFFSEDEFDSVKKSLKDLWQVAKP